MLTRTPHISGSGACVSERLAAGAEAPAAARDALRGLAGRVPAQHLESLELVASELVTNAIRHGGARGSRAIGFEVACGADEVTVTVTDPGTGFDPAGDRAEPGADGGWGLYILDDLAEAWWVEPAGPGTRVCARLGL